MWPFRAHGLGTRQTYVEEKRVSAAGGTGVEGAAQGSAAQKVNKRAAQRLDRSGGIAVAWCSGARTS